MMDHLPEGNNKRGLTGGAAAAIAGAAVLLVAVLVLVFYRPAAAPPIDSSSTSVTAPSETTRGASLLCVIGEWEGKLAVFQPSGSSPSEVFDVYISSLPEQEQQKLKDGIPVYDEETLAGLLEDYTS